MATPVLRAIRRSFPEAKITHIGRPVALEVLCGSNLSDEQIEDYSGRRPKLLNLIRQARRIGRLRFDLAILLANSFRSALLCRLARIKRIAGYDRDGRGWLLSDRLAPPRDDRGNYKPLPMVDYYNALASTLGIHVNSPEISLSVTDSGEESAKSLLDSAGVDRSRPIVMLNPGASFGPSKIWPIEAYAAVADTLIERRGAQIIINAAPDERQIALELAGAMGNPPAINLAEHQNSISLLKSLLSLTSLLITNDTGARHIGAAMGASVVTIFGSTDPIWSRIDYPHERIVRIDVTCSPCQKKRCPLPHGPEYHQCMVGITPEMVLAASEELLDLFTNTREERTT